jgi:hypothetical protein
MPPTLSPTPATSASITSFPLPFYAVAYGAYGHPAVVFPRNREPAPLLFSTAAALSYAGPPSGVGTSLETLMTPAAAAPSTLERA